MHRPLPDNTQHSHERDIHTPGRIRISNPSKRAAADLGLRPRDHRDRRSRFSGQGIFLLTYLLTYLLHGTEYILRS